MTWVIVVLDGREVARDSYTTPGWGGLFEVPPVPPIGALVTLDGAVLRVESVALNLDTQQGALNLVEVG